MLTLVTNAPESSISSRNSYQKLKQPFRKNGIGQNSFCFNWSDIVEQNTSKNQNNN